MVRNELPDIEQENKDERDAQPTLQAVPELPQRNRLKVEWESNEDEGKHEVRLSGTLTFEVVETVGDNGEILFNSAFLRTRQDELKDALAISLKNGVNRAFQDKWNERFPPAQRERAQRETLTSKNMKLEERNKQLQVVQAELMDALMNKRPVDLDKLREQGIDPAEFGLGESPNAAD